MTIDPLSGAPPRWLARLTSGLRRTQRPIAPSRVLEPMLATEELLAWSRDDGRWNPRATADWQSLLDDVDASWSGLGPRVAAIAGVEDHLRELRLVRAASKITSADHRATVDAAACALTIALDAPDALAAAFDDLLDAARHSNQPQTLDDDTRWQMALLASVGERQGHDWATIADRVRRALGSNRTGPLSQSIPLVHRALTAPSLHGHSVVWLAIDYAWVEDIETVTPITLFNGEWLIEVLRAWTGPVEGVPDEIAADPRALIEACPRFEDGSDPREQLPVTIARIDLGSGPAFGARARARETLDLLIARASARQNGSHWKINDACLHYLDGDLVFMESADIGEPGLFERLNRSRVMSDPTGALIVKETSRLRGHIPVRDGRLREALQLSDWLTQTRRASPPARLVLSMRIIEQTANWSHIPARDLISNYLALTWAWKRVAVCLSHAGVNAVLRLHGANGMTGSNEDRQIFLRVSQELIGDRFDRGPLNAPPWKVLARLPWLAEQHTATSETGEELRELQQRLADGRSTYAWLTGMCGELTVLNRRAVRTRNAVVHGGPLIVGVTETVGGVQDVLASQALEWVIDGLGAERSLKDAFDEHRTRYADALARLSDGGDPNVELPAAAQYEKAWPR